MNLITRLSGSLSAYKEAERKYESYRKDDEKALEECVKIFEKYCGLDSKNFEEYDYRAFVTRRCFNLNEYFCHEGYYSKKKAKTLDEKRDSFMSQNALLTYAPEIAEFYMKNKRFPKILVVDEVVFYGRETNSFLNRFEAAVRRVFKIRSNRLLFA